MNENKRTQNECKFPEVAVCVKCQQNVQAMTPVMFAFHLVGETKLLCTSPEAIGTAIIWDVLGNFGSYNDNRNRPDQRGRSSRAYLFIFVSEGRAGGRRGGGRMLINGSNL